MCSGSTTHKAQRLPAASHRPGQVWLRGDAAESLALVGTALAVTLKGRIRSHASTRPG
jgi:hypothetical protein